MRNDVLERVPMSLCTSIKSFLVIVFLALFFSETISIIHYIERLNLIYTLEIMVKSPLKNRRLQYSDSRSCIQKSSRIFTKEAFFQYKISHNFKCKKLWKKIFRTYVDLSVLKMCTTLLGQEPRNKQVRGKNKPLIYK